MSYTERLINIARLQYERAGVIHLAVIASLAAEGIDVSALEDSFASA